jgi:hypothetical protein
VASDEGEEYARSPQARRVAEEQYVRDHPLYPWEEGAERQGAGITWTRRFKGEPCNDGILLIGKRRSGKSRLGAVILPQLCTPENGVIVDPVGVFTNSLPAGYKHVVLSDQNAPAFFRSVYHGPSCFVAIDELDKISGPRFGASGFCCKEMYEFIHQGRSFGHGYMGLARDCANIPKDTIRNADHLFLARATETNTMLYLRGILTDYDGLEYAPILRQLPEHVFLYWRPTRTPCFGGFYSVVDNELVEVLWSPTTEPIPLEGTAEDTTETPPPTDTPGRDTVETAVAGAPGPAPTAGDTPSSGSRSGTASSPPRAVPGQG